MRAPIPRQPRLVGHNAFDNSCRSSATSYVLFVFRSGSKPALADDVHDYTIGMKTAISIPDEIFKKAERLARRLGISRSQLYAHAIEDYVKRRVPESITEAMNHVVDEVGHSDEELVSAAARRVRERTEW